MSEILLNIIGYATIILTTIAITVGIIAVIANFINFMKNTIQCPFCKEYINKEATKCPKCQSVLEEGK